MHVAMARQPLKGSDSMQAFEMQAFEIADRKSGL
jgi:hypothetical protein